MVIFARAPVPEHDPETSRSMSDRGFSGGGGAGHPAKWHPNGTKLVPVWLPNEQKWYPAGTKMDARTTELFAGNLVRKLAGKLVQELLAGDLVGNSQGNLHRIFLQGSL